MVSTRKEGSVCESKYLIVSCVRHHTRAIDEEDSLHECDVLPDLRLSRDRGRLAALLAHERVDHTRLPCVRVSDHANRYLTFIL